jgi:hypothetical protein
MYIYILYLCIAYISSHSKGPEQDQLRSPFVPYVRNTAERSIHIFDSAPNIYIYIFYIYHWPFRGIAQRHPNSSDPECICRPPQWRVRIGLGWWCLWREHTAGAAPSEEGAVGVEMSRDAFRVNIVKIGCTISYTCTLFLECKNMVSKPFKLEVQSQERSWNWCDCRDGSSH